MWGRQHWACLLGDTVQTTWHAHHLCTVAAEFVALSTLRADQVPAMNISFTVTTALLGMRTLTVEEVSTAPLGNLPVFAGTTPADVSVVVLGLANCSGATGRINATSHSLTITLPSSCVVVANALVTVEIPQQFFAPNPAAGTTVELAIHCNVVSEPLTIFEYTTGMIYVMHAPGRTTSVPVQCSGER